VQQFRNLKRNAPAQKVCAALPGVTHLSDFEGMHATAVHRLHTVMCATGKAPSPDVLGGVGEAHFRRSFEDWYGVKRYWYQTRADTHEGVPCVVEVAMAETVDGGDLWTGINFSPTLATPVANTPLRCDKLVAQSLRGALEHLTALPDPMRNPNVAVAVHLVCPTLEFLDKGKTQLKVAGWMADLLAKALWGAGKTRYQEAAQREKDDAKAEKEEKARERAKARQSPTMTQIEAVFQVLPAALAKASGDGAYEISARWLYYPVRDMIQALTDDPLKFGYFSQTLLPRYQREVGPIPGLYYEPRGILYEPHTGQAIPLGTQSVRDYVFPSWLYDKIFYVEKKGAWPILHSAQLAERYDMAVCVGEGFATEAIRVLFDHASKQQHYQLFVLHDSDAYGYNIARTLREETARMPGYAVEVIDLGLRWEDAMALGLDPETFTRRVALPEGLALVLTPEERRTFEGRAQHHYEHQRRSWICERVELNALTAPQLVTYIEQRLADVGVRGKIVPPADHLKATAQELYRQAVASQARDAIAALLPIAAMIDRLQDAFTAAADLTEAQTWITEAVGRDPALWWKNAVRGKIGGLVWDERDAITAAVRAALAQAIQDGALTESEDGG
jgi:hypothetical protein